MAEDKTARARRADETIAGLLRGGATPLSPSWTSQTLAIWLLQATSHERECAVRSGGTMIDSSVRAAALR
jgi:hypothetical protein